MEKYGIYLDKGGDFAVNLATAVAVLVIGRWIVRWLCNVSVRQMERADVDSTLVSFLRNLIYFSLLAAVVIAALGRLGINTTSFMAVLGAAGLAIGLALKDSLSNFAAGVMLILFRPFKLGDFVNAGGASGTVKEVSIFRTELATPDNQKVIVPNGAIMGGVITNVTAHDTRRVDLVFGIGYDDDIDRAREILTSLMAADQRVLQDPAPIVGVLELGASSVDLYARAWTKTSNYFSVRCDLQEKVKKAFDKAGISIPYPQQDVHMHAVQ